MNDPTNAPAKRTRGAKAPAAVEIPFDPHAAAKAGPEPETLKQAALAFLNKATHVVYKKKLGDLQHIIQQVEQFLAIGHPILEQYCVPVAPEVEKHFRDLKAKK